MCNYDNKNVTVSNIIFYNVIPNIAWLKVIKCLRICSAKSPASLLEYETNILNYEKKSILKYLVKFFITFGIMIIYPQDTLLHLSNGLC